MTTEIIEVKPTTPLSLIEQALSNGLRADELTKLFDLQERWERNQAVQAFNIALNECQADLPRVVKDRENTHTRSRYATLEAVNTAVMPVFAKHGFSISFNEDECSVADSIKLSATVRHSGGHSETFSTVVPLDGVGIKGNANKTATQSKGSTIAYGRRYLMLMIGNINVAEEDDDGNSSSATLTEEQVAFLQGIVDQCEAAGDPLHRGRFFQMFNLPADSEFSEILQSKYEAAKQGLAMKLQKAKAGAHS
jgi:hypothetical protein